MPHYVEPVFRPPSEARSLIFQITIGCSQERCAFCGMYRGKRFRIRPPEEILGEINELSPSYRSRFERVFLADGDALVYPQEGLTTILDALNAAFPSLSRVGCYASPKSLTTKSPEQLEQLRLKKLDMLYFGLESGDAETLRAIGKGYSPDEMAELAIKAHQTGMRLSVTAILGLAGKGRSLEHARATAAWVNRVNPDFFSLLTLFRRHNEEFIASLERCSHGELMLEAHEVLSHLRPEQTILRSNHISNFLNLAGSFPDDRQRLIDDLENAIVRARSIPGFFDALPSYSEQYY